MTIICVRDGVMAADSGCWSDDLAFGSVTKIVRVNGDLVAGAGEAEVVEQFYAWIRGGQERPAPLDKETEFGALMLRADGIWRIGRSFVFYRDPSPFAAEGMHRQFAMGVMATGRSAEEAVRLCIEHGAWARGPVQVERR